jgi:peptidoglycan/LPS O-acetylase OafA/YrhL
VFFDNPLQMAFKTPIPQLWTMPIELAGSLLVVGLLWLTGLRRIRYLAYALALGILGWWMPLLAAFIVGIVLAEINESGIAERVRPQAGYLLIPSLAAAALLPGQGGIPYLAVATLIAFSTSFSAIGRRFLSSRLSRFLGEVSFPLYLLHGLVIFSYGTWILGKTSTPAFLLIANVSIAVIAVAVSWLFRWIDILGIKAAQLVSRRILTPNAANPNANEAARSGQA